MGHVPPTALLAVGVAAADQVPPLVQWDVVGDPTGQALLPVEETPPGEQALGEATQLPDEGSITGRLTTGELIMGRHMTGLIPLAAATAAGCCWCC